MIHHYYHVFADGFWRRPVLEHVAALDKITADMAVTVGTVGSMENRLQVIDTIQAEEYHGGPEGYEQFTLDFLYRDLHNGVIADDDVVLYAHSKGAAYSTDVSDVWRRCMTRHLINGWRAALLALKGGADCVGCHWLTPEQYPDSVQSPYYGGNFWWATAAHLRSLPAPSHETRFHAETWLGTVRPEQPVDFASGWPGAGCRDHLRRTA